MPDVTGPPASIAAVRVALREALEEFEVEGARVVVACSGGADSLALALAAQFVMSRLGGQAGAVVVDHQLQPGSALVAEEAAAACQGIGLQPTEVVTVEVPATGTGLEDAARMARYAALWSAAHRQGAAVVLLGHTLNDQAEQVLLGLARGSGARSLSGMPTARLLRQPSTCATERPASGATERPTTGGRAAVERDDNVLLVRPFLGLGRGVTEQACREAGLRPWNDPHNADGRYARVRARSLVQRLDQDLGPGVAAALSRSAELLRADADALDQLSETAYQGLGPLPWAVEDLAAHPEAIRTRVLRRAVLRAASPSGSLRAEHLRAMDQLLTRWRGQGPIDLPGRLQMRRSDGRIWLEASKTS